jgi:hypothetical protein
VEQRSSTPIDHGALTNALADERRSTDGFSSGPEEWMQLIRLFSFD